MIPRRIAATTAGALRSQPSGISIPYPSTTLTEKFSRHNVFPVAARKPSPRRCNPRPEGRALSRRCSPGKGPVEVRVW